MRVGKQRYGQPIPDDDWGGRPTIRADKVRLSQIVASGEPVIDYTYDSGDCWEHRLICFDVRPGDPDKVYPRYVAGERPAPPEDGRGIPGFYYGLEVLADPNHPEHGAVAEGFDGYDPDDFYDLPAKVAIGRNASRRRAGKVRKDKPSAT